MAEEVRGMLDDAKKYECNMHRMYLKYAKIAEREGYVNISRLFKALAEAKKIHLKFFFRILHGREIESSDYSDIPEEEFSVEDTLRNLENALEMEIHEERIAYSNGMKKSLKAQQAGAFIMFNQAKLSEESHRDAIKKALEAIKSGKDLEIKTGIFVCPNCGYLTIDRAPGHCPVCGIPGNQFLKF